MSERQGEENVTERVLKHNEKFNVPIQTEKEEAEVFEEGNAPQDLANEEEIKRKKEGLE